MREIACFAEINFHSIPDASCKRNFSFLISTASPLWCTISTRTGKRPANCKFVSNNSWVSSSVNRGEARNESEPTFALADEAGIAGSSLTGFTLKSEPLQDAVRRASTQKLKRVAALEIGNVVRIILIETLAGDLNRLGSCGHARSDVMKLGGVDHVQ